MSVIKKVIPFFSLLIIIIKFLYAENLANLAPNPSFEEGDVFKPTGWVSLASGKTSIETVNYRSGKRSLAVFRTLYPNGQPIFAGWESQPIKLKENREYILYGFVKTLNATGYTYLSLAWFQDDRVLKENISDVLQGDNDWKQLIVVASPPPQANYLRIRLISQGNSGSAYFDDIYLVALPKKEFNINLAPNPSFEDGLGDKPYDWEIAREWGDNAEQFRSTQYAHKGIYSLLIRNSSNGLRMAGWKSKGFPVVSGKLYTFTVWIKTKNAAGETYPVIAWFNEKGWICNSYHCFSLTGNNDWTKISVSDLPPEGATYAILYLRSDDNPGAAWFDDVRLNLTESLMSEIAVPNASFEIESDFWQPWLAEGHSREIRIDDSFAYEGRHSLMIRDAVGKVAWQSREMRLFCNRPYLYRLSCKVKSEGEEGKVFIWIAWTIEGEDLKKSQSISAPLLSDGWIELSLLAKPPEKARGLSIFLGCQDFKGTVWFDDVKMEQILPPLEERRVITEEDTPLEYYILRHYQTLSVVSPDRLFRCFEDTFGGIDESKKIIDGLLPYLGEHPEKKDKEMQRVMGILFFHNGDYGIALRYMERLLYINPYDSLDLRYDAVLHYIYWAKLKLEEEKKEKAEEIERKTKVALGGKPEETWKLLLSSAEKFFKLGMYKEARETYEQLLRQYQFTLNEFDISNFHFRIGLCLFQEKRYREAINKFNDFLQSFPRSELREEAIFYIAKSLRYQGDILKALALLKDLWKESKNEELSRDVEKELISCYHGLKDREFAIADYKSFFNRKTMPGVLYIGDDINTMGNWELYGNLFCILPMKLWGLGFVAGGLGEPLRLSGLAKYNDGIASSKTSKYKIICRLYTGDPANPVRTFFPPQSDMGWWDDRGETHPFDENGPDLFIDLKGIPEGVYRLTLCMREHEVRIMDDEKNILSVKPRKETMGRDNSPDIYECFVVFGPVDLTIQIIKGKSLCALLKGIFLDKLYPPEPLPEIKVGKPEEDEGKKSLFNKAKEIYEEMRKKWEDEPYRFYENLNKFREIISLLYDYISLSPETTEALLAEWMIWQCYHQLPGEFEKEEKAKERYIEHFLSLRGNYR
jgi:tetratricopeptide (TPR) repeat protein